jgi:predicted short-subunit dehydrogenase-like oxidoreductase (DUF2520 family)
MGSKITFIGSGKVAWHLAKAFDLAGHRIHQIISRNELTGKELAKKYAAFFDNNTQNVLEDSDFVFITVPDKSIETVIQSISANQPIFLHCSGSCELSKLSSHKANTGVFYPLQTFTKERALNYFEIPIFIESSHLDLFQKIWELADSISNTINQLDSEKRKHLHLSAVIANNFTNHLLGEAQWVVQSMALPFHWLKPLVEETVKKAFELGPEKSQTGPALRKDELTLKLHKEMLESNSDLQNLYEVFSIEIAKKAT